jgi:hypothetical protein
MATAVVIKDCDTCGGTGHVNHRLCDTCEGYGQIDSDGVKHMTMARLTFALSKWAAEKGWPYGIPIPSLGPSTNRVVIAKRAPFGDREVPILSMPEMLGNYVPRELKAEKKLKLINSWFTKHGEIAAIVEDENGKRGAYYLGSHPIAGRLTMILETMGTRLGAVTARAESKAMMNLAERLIESQINSYLLSGCFLETSPRSHVHYLFRKGLPTLALGESQDKKNIRFLAGLCLHPLAYYEDTFCGSMAPSDDVLAHLLLMRADEHRFWKESNQHPLWDPRSGV